MVKINVRRDLPARVNGALVVDIDSAAKRACSLEPLLKKHVPMGIAGLLAANGFTGKSGQSLYLPAAGASSPAALFLGAAGIEKLKSTQLFGKCRELGARVAKTAEREKRSRVVVHFAVGANADVALDGFIEGLALGSYHFTKYVSARSAHHAGLAVTLVTPKAPAKGVVDSALLRSAAIVGARDLVNLPPCDLNPATLVRQARDVARRSRLGVRVLNVAALRRLKAGGILTVGKGSTVPPSLVRLVYKPRRKRRNAPVIALVGKGVTFDSGGLSLKTGDGMMTMKCDMAGAAAVLMSMSAIAKLGPDVEVRAYLPVVENMVSGGSARPGDVYRALNGKTVEVLNTDAEGRLILADALALAVREGCDEVVDLATLTGACMVALGTDVAGLYASNDALGKRLLDASEAAGEPLWRMPLVDEYRALLKSKIADLKNIGGRYGGSITAALFLSEFVGKTHWAHLDIAGPAFAEKVDGHIAYGGTGFGVSTLVRYVMAR